VLTEELFTPRDGNGAGIPRPRRDPAPKQGKFPTPLGNGAGGRGGGIFPRPRPAPLIPRPRRSPAPKRGKFPAPVGERGGAGEENPPRSGGGAGEYFPVPDPPRCHPYSPPSPGRVGREKKKSAAISCQSVISGTQIAWWQIAMAALNVSFILKIPPKPILFLPKYHHFPSFSPPCTVRTNPFVYSIISSQLLLRLIVF